MQSSGIRLPVAGNGGRGRTRQKPASIAWTHHRSHFRPPNPRCRRSRVFRLRRAWSVRRVPLACIPQTQGPKEFLGVADLQQSWANRRFLFSTTYESPELVRVLRLCKDQVPKSRNNQPGFSQPRRARPTGISVDRLPRIREWTAVAVTPAHLHVWTTPNHDLPNSKSRGAP
jgi:hypothetical protein